MWLTAACKLCGSLQFDSGELPKDGENPAGDAPPEVNDEPAAEGAPVDTKGAPEDNEGAPADTEGAPADTEGAPAGEVIPREAGKFVLLVQDVIQHAQVILS